MDRWQDISISDASLKAEFITKFFNGDYIDAFTIISNNPQLNTKAFVADTINQIATILLSLENNFQNGVINYLAQQYSNFQNIIDNYNLKGNWSASTTYQIYNFVTYNNIDYLYINSTPSSGNLPTNTDYWVEINIQGEKGAPGLGVNLQYNWNATTPYNALDVVYYNNALWVARVANINKVPGSTEEWETLTGSIVSFYNDGDIDISNLSVAVEPVQDLHGYDSPWPAGGGVNKYPILIGADTFVDNTGAAHSNDNGTLVINCAAQTNSGVYAHTQSQIRQLPADYTGAICYSFSIKASTTATILAGYERFGYQNISATTSWQRVSITSTADGSQSAFVVYTRSGAVTVEVKDFQFEIGSTAHDYAPYSNLCPISGWSEVGIERAGVNLITTQYAHWNNSSSDTVNGVKYSIGDDGGITFTGTATAVTRLTLDYNALLLIAGNTYTLSVEGATSDFRWISTGGPSSTGFEYTSMFGDFSKSYTITRNVHPQYMFIDVASGATVNTTVYIQLELGQTATNYYPYAGNTYTIQLGQTFYGGTLDAVNGTLTVDRAVHTFDGTEVFSGDGAANAVVPRWNYFVAGPIYTGYGISNMLKRADSYASIRNTPFSMSIGAGYRILLNPEGKTYANTNAAAKAIAAWCTDMYNAGTPLQVCYGLATPIEIPLTPTQIATIAGQTNNVWADAGDVTVELSKKYWEEFIKFKLASIYTDYIEPSGDSLYNGLIWFEVFNSQNWSYLTNRNYTWNQINTNNDTWESVDRGDY